jgi:hypothetical protein
MRRIMTFPSTTDRIYDCGPILTNFMEQSPSSEANRFVASREIPRIFMEPERSLPYSQVPTTCPYPEPTPSSPHHPLQLSEDPS